VVVVVEVVLLHLVDMAMEEMVVMLEGLPQVQVVEVL
jgi:hypothetical protein